MALFQDGNRRTAIVALDQAVVTAPIVAVLRAAIENAIGLPAADCLVCATHTHNAPALISWRLEDDAFALADVIAARLGPLARELAAALRPVKFTASEVAVPGWSWNRRALFRRDDGRLGVATHGPRDSAGFQGMEGRDDPEVRTLFAYDESGRCMGGLVNFGCHPTCMYNETVWSADYPGVLLEQIEARLGGDWVFLTGPAGDLSQLAGVSSVQHPWGIDYCRHMGRALAERVVESSSAAKAVADAPITVAIEKLAIFQRKVSADQVRIAREYLAMPAGTAGKESLVTRLYGYAFHFHPSVHKGGAQVNAWLAEEILGMWEWQRRAGERNLVEQVEIQVLALGEIAFVGFPCELFVELGDVARANSPFAQTHLVQLANGWHGYVPTEAAFLNGGYECCLAYQSRLAVSAGSEMAASAANLLKRAWEEGAASGRRRPS